MNDKLSIQEVRQVLSEQPGFFATLAEALGVTPAGLNERLEAGRVGTHEALWALARLAPGAQAMSNAITLETVKDWRLGDQIVKIRGEVHVADVRDVAQRNLLGSVLLDAATQPDASVGDYLRLLAFYCDARGRRG